MKPENKIQDDPTIGNEVPLWRKVSPQSYIWNQNLGVWRVSSAAFQNYRDSQGNRYRSFSICVSCDAEELGAGPADIIAGMPGYGVAAFSTGLARQLDQGVTRVPQEGEIAHGHVNGDKPKNVQRALAKDSTVLIAPAVEGQ